MKINKKLKWALVLSGGGAKGFAHIGVLKTFSEMGFPEPSMIIGTSMGAIVGGLYACGMSPEEINRFALEEFKLEEHLDSFVFKINGIVGRVFQTGQIIGNLATRPGIDSGQMILQLLEKLTGGKTFDDTRIPFRCNAVDLITGREVVLKTGSVARAIRASISFPAFFEPFQEGDDYLVDGGLANNMPVFIPRLEGIPRVLAVDVGGFQILPMESMKTGPKIIYRSMEVALHNIRHTEEPRADLTIRASGDETPFSFSRIQSIIDLGAQAVQENRKAVNAFFGSGIGAYFARAKYRECGICSTEPAADSGKEGLFA
ncbi:patatin-like phospholipase family protein [Breznakiella homolactica]|uniref:Patatin-like phospholipase family protein n=1 Tax=Breznakiella homolactica TaxID=2798577 RepID=A0A7T7XMU4_9SPIR|nr:patatin-like phospholipase family protein [Breznakiella homolactica]QQO09206.1 patatin-like phospholipase family protein [Breznakiella homolactica]